MWILYMASSNVQLVDKGEISVHEDFNYIGTGNWPRFLDQYLCLERLNGYQADKIIEWKYVQTVKVTQ